MHIKIVSHGWLQHSVYTIFIARHPVNATMLAFTSFVILQFWFL